MKEKNNQIIWEPQELIYDVGDASNEAFLVIQGFVYLYTQLSYHYFQLSHF